MSARRIGSTELFDPAAEPAPVTQLTLPTDAVRISKNGLEFRSSSPIAAWTELTVALETPLHPRKFHCNGVVVSCHGNRLSGYDVLLLFTSLSRQAQAQLSALA